MQIPGRRSLRLSTAVKQAVAGFQEVHILIYTAALAHYILLAIFLFLIFLIALLGVLKMPARFD